jgi:hypothetical protein
VRSQPSRKLTSHTPSGTAGRADPRLWRVDNLEFSSAQYELEYWVRIADGAGRRRSRISPTSPHVVRVLLSPMPKITGLMCHQILTFKTRSYELVGEGMMHRAPDHEHVVAYWDYTVEND